MNIEDKEMIVSLLESEIEAVKERINKLHYAMVKGSWKITLNRLERTLNNVQKES